MGKILKLDDSISSKIAAGEVIERPASAVKELVENSIDAGSRHIKIEIEKGGKKLIRVIDDGEGISREDVIPAFERHATSKIHKLDDIFNIKTLGFRGEALPSIACVSEVMLMTKTNEELTGTRCEIKDGIINRIEEAPAKDGCCFEIKNLFYNTPARLKFLGSDTQEASHIIDYVLRIAMGNPDISFRFVSDGKEIFYTSGNGDYREVIARVYGKDIAKNMIYIEKSFPPGSIRGFISTPQASRGNRTGETFFVNRRLIKNKGLSYTLERAYKTFLPISRFPISLVMIDIDNSQVDVNVHPTKLEIKFKNEHEIHKALYDAATYGLKTSILIPQERFNDKKNILDLKKASPKILEEQSTFNFDEDKKEEKEEGKHLSKSVYFPSTHDIINKRLAIYESGENDPYSLKKVVNKADDINGKLNIKRILGQLFGTYIIAEGEEEFYMIDQHAAHERVLFEKYSKRYNQKPISQQLIEPYTLQLSIQDFAFIQEYWEDIKAMGFDLSPFGKDTVLIRAVPYFFDKALKPEILSEVLDNFRGEEYNVLNQRDKFIASMACHTAIKAGDVLNSIHMIELIDQLKELENPFTCPHGRPTIISMTINELEKKFKRII